MSENYILNLRKNMKRLLAFVLFFFAYTQAQAQFLDFTLVNRTGDIIWGMHVSSSTSPEWGDDIIPTDILDDGKSVNVTFNTDGSAECEWDIKLDKDILGEEVELIFGVDLCSVSKITVYKDDDGNYFFVKE